MMIQRFFMTFLAMGLVIGALQCSGDSSLSASDDDSGGGRAATSSGAAVGAVFGGLGGEGNLSEPEAKIPRIILNYLIQTAVAQTEDIDACDSVTEGGGPSGVTMEDDGTDDTYGNPDDSITVAAGSDVSFCADGGDVAAWTIPGTVSVTCSDDGESFTASLSGSGVFRMEIDESMNITTLIRGNFVITSGDDTITTGCSFDLQSDGTFAGEGCEGTDTFSTDAACESPDEGEGGEDETEGEAGEAGEESEEDEEDDLTTFAGTYSMTSTSCGSTDSMTLSGSNPYSDSSNTTTLSAGGSCTTTTMGGTPATSCSYTGSGSAGSTIVINWGGGCIMTLTKL